MLFLLELFFAGYFLENYQIQCYNVGILNFKGINMTTTTVVNPEQFLDQDIFDLLQLPNLSKEKKDKIIKDMLETVNNRVIARILDLLEEKNQQEQFFTLLQGNQNQAIDDFLEQQNIDIKKISLEESLLYKMEIANTLN